MFLTLGYLMLQFFVSLALRKVEKYLGLEKLYVLGTNCGKHISYSNQRFHYL
jgi:coenzyme F420-reducing hydrogenase beta subunit